MSNNCIYIHFRLNLSLPVFCNYYFFLFFPICLFKVCFFSFFLFLFFFFCFLFIFPGLSVFYFRSCIFLLGSASVCFLIHVFNCQTFLVYLIVCFCLFSFPFLSFLFLPPPFFFFFFF